MKRLLLIAMFGLFLAGFKLSAQTNPPPGVGVETLVCIRHGEKPLGGLGQLTCQGLNRALALPAVLLAKFGVPQFLFAPNPSQTMIEGAGVYSYIRPLATIEPTAIYLGLPVNTQFGFAEIANLELELAKPNYWNATVFLAWEHVYLVAFVRDMLAAYGGDTKQIPLWASDDFDTIFVIKIARNGNQVYTTFLVDHEGLNGMPASCLLPGVRPLGAEVQSHQFGFRMVGLSNATTVVESSTNLASAAWSRLSTNVLSGGASYFGDPAWTNYPRRFYRLSVP